MRQESQHWGGPKLFSGNWRLTIPKNTGSDWETRLDTVWSLNQLGIHDAVLQSEALIEEHIQVQIPVADDGIGNRIGYWAQHAYCYISYIDHNA